MKWGVSMVQNDVWVSTYDKLPENGVRVLCAVSAVVSEWQEVLYYDGLTWATTQDEDFPYIVTHWQPLGPMPQLRKN